MGIISVDFDATGQLLVINFAFVKYLKGGGAKEAVDQLFIDFKTAYDSVRREVLYNILTEFGIHETGNANKNVSERYLQQSTGRKTFV